MTPRWLSEHHRPIVGTVMALWAVILAGFVALVVIYELDFFGPVGGPWVLAFSAFVITGALITWQRPDHVIGPLFLTVGSAITLANGVSAVSLGPLADHSATVRAFIAAAGVAVGTASFVLMPIAIVLFPDGRLPSARWRWIWSAAVLTSTIGGVAAFLVGAFNGDEREVIVGPPFPGVPAAIGRSLSAIYLSLTAAVMAAGAIAIVLRYRRSDATIRRQIRWLVLAVLLFAALSAAFVLADLVLADLVLRFSVTEEAAIAMLNLTVAGAVALVPLSVTIAILRHRLFDIDVVISRSVVLAVLAGFIATVYVTVVVGVGRLIGTAGEPRLGLKIIATAIVAVAFQPLRLRARRFADRLVLGHRATPYEVLAGFSRQATNAGDEVTLRRVAELLAAGTGAEPAVVWLRVGDDLRPAAVSGDAPAPPSQPLVGGELPELGVSLVVPVHHEEELLGAVTLTKPSSEPVSDQDEELTTRLAAGLSLVLRNARLTAELKEHLQDLEASRQRIVQAQDEVRRKIERDLRAGAQRYLVDLGRQLEVARGKAAASGADQTARLLAQLDAEVADARGTLRDLAQGIYPPLLESEGLGAALAERAERSPLPVTVHASGVGRYGREIEGAVYFCVLEALQNAARYSDASSVHVRLEDNAGVLRFEVADDGVGFEPAAIAHGSGLRGIADRLDTIGGGLSVHSVPGVGTRISGRMPIPVGAGAVRETARTPMEV